MFRSSVPGIFATCVLVFMCAVITQCAVPASKRCIVPASTLPESTPWNLEALSAPPEFEWGEGKEVRSLYYKGEPFRGKPTRVFAYYATPGTLSGDPAKDKNLPAMVLVHGGGGRAFDQWVRVWAGRGYAAIAMDLGGCGPEKKVRLPDGGPGQGHDMKFDTIGGPVTDQWTYHAVANVIRAHSLIRSFPEVDASRTGLTGISWGGYLTCIVAGLDNRFRAAVPVYGCGFLNESSAWVHKFESMSPENAAKWVRLWDPSQYVGSAAMPMLFVNGGKDHFYRPVSYAKTYALVHSPKNLHYVPHLPHGHIFDRPKAIEVFIDSHLRGGMPLACVVSLDTRNGKVETRVDTPTKLVSGKLCYTRDALPGTPKKREWEGVPATIQGNTVVAPLPPKDATVWFLTVTDARDTTVSSEIRFASKK